MVVGLRLVKEGKAQAFISAGNTGAVLAGGVFVVGRIKGIDRPCLCPALPNVKRGMTIISDGGANADCKPINLVQFAGMSNIYASKVLKINNPKVALANIGIEEGKGNLAYHSLKKLREISGHSIDYILFGVDDNSINKTKEFLKNFSEEEIVNSIEIIKKLCLLIKEK